MDSPAQKQPSTPQFERQPTEGLPHVNQSGSATGPQHTELARLTETQVTETLAVDGSRRIGAYVPDPDDNDRAIHPILDRWDVAALIINKVVGTGIFTGPPMVLLYTQNKVEAMLLWILGLMYTYLSMLMYLGYAEALPFNGGELIYLDAIFSKPRMFVYVLYGVQFVCLINGTTNCLQFGTQVLYADLKEPKDLDQRLVRLFAVCILTLVCFTIAYSNSLFRSTNKVFAGLKMLGMVALFIGGVVSGARQKDKTFGQVDVEVTPKDARLPALNHFLALSSVLYAYNGWENATFVRADIRVMGKKDELARGFLIGGIAVGLGYIGINTIFLVAIDPYIIPDFQYAPWLFGNTHGARRFWAIATAISAVGSIGSTMYTSAKVKQSMAASNILPWSRLWIKQNRQNSPTPAGALALHWIWGVISITYTAAIPDLSQATAFPGFLQIYAQKVFGIFIAFGYLFLGRSRQRDQENQIQQNWNQSNKKLRTCRLQDFGVWIMVIFVCICNVGFVIFPCIPPYTNIYNSKGYIINGYTYPAVTASLVGIAAIYHLLCFSNPGDTGWSLLRLVGLKSEIRPLCTHQRHPYFGYEYRVFITDPEALEEPKGKEKSASRPEIMVEPAGSANIPHTQAPSRPAPATEVPEIDSAVLIEEKTFGQWLRTWVRFIFGWEILSHLEKVDPYHGPNAVGCNCYPERATEVKLPQGANTAACVACGRRE